MLKQDKSFSVVNDNNKSKYKRLLKQKLDEEIENRAWEYYNKIEIQMLEKMRKIRKNG